LLKTNPTNFASARLTCLRRNVDDPPDKDFSGFDFWLGKLDQFKGDYRAAEMVKAFITSAEYRHRFGP
jgi:hypothetical protein